MKKRTAYLLSILFIIQQPGLAQDTIPELEPAVITANLKSQIQKETGRNILTFQGDYFNALPVHSLDELLRYLPGIEIQQRGPQGSQSDLIIRGGTFQQVIVLIDGIRMNDPLTGHFSGYIPIHPSEIDRVEILKGAASAIYGSDAVGGVIHIITKTFSGKKQHKNTARMMVTAGEYALSNASGYYNMEKEHTTLAVSAIRQYAGGQRLRGTRGYFDINTLNFSVSQELNSNWRLSFRTAGDFRDFNAQNFYTVFVSDTSTEKVNSFWNHLNLVKKLKQGTLYFDVGFKKLRDQFLYNKSSKPNDNRTQLLTSQVYITTPVASKHTLTTGLQVYKKRIRSNDRGNHDLWHGALYSVFTHRVGKNLYFNESLRLDVDESYGAVMVPQVNVSWSPSQFTVRASAGRTIRDADFTERYNNYNKSLVTGGRIGNQELEAEQSWNAELGVDYHLSNKLRISSTVFYRDHKDLIDWTPTPYADMPRKENLVPTGSYALARNIQEIRTLGFELDVIYKMQIRSSVHLMSTAGFTWIRSENDDPVPSFYISSHARHLFNFSGILTIRSFSFSFSGLYKNRMAQKASSIQAEITPSYLVFNSKLSYQFKSNAGRLFLQADNIADRKYSDLLGSQMPDRWISGGFEIAL